MKGRPHLQRAGAASGAAPAVRALTAGDAHAGQGATELPHEDDAADGGPARYSGRAERRPGAGVGAGVLVGRTAEAGDDVVGVKAARLALGKGIFFLQLGQRGRYYAARGT